MAKYRALEKYLRELGYDPGEIIDLSRPPAKAYKLFRQREGELYPLFVNADQPVPMGQWLEADVGPLTAGGKVKSKIGDLAYRPGWHAGDLPIATHIGGKAPERGRIPTKPNYRPDEQVWAEIEMPGAVDWQRLALDRADRSKAGNIIPRTAHITDRLPTGGFYRYKTNPNMTGEWLIGGEMKVNRLLEDAEVRDINRAAGVEDLPRLRNLQRRKGYVPAAAGGAIGLGALTDSEEAEAGGITPALRAAWNLSDEALERAAAQGYNLDEVLWHGSRANFDRFEPGRLRSTFFTPDFEYAQKYGTPKPYVIRPGRQLDMYNNPQHEQMVADRFNARGGWSMADEEFGIWEPDELLARGPEPYNYNRELDDQWEILDEMENGVLSEFIDDYDTFRFGEDASTQAVMVPEKSLDRVKRLDAKFLGPGLLGGTAAVAALGGSEEAEAMPTGQAAMEDPDVDEILYNAQARPWEGSYDRYIADTLWTSPEAKREQAMQAWGGAQGNLEGLMEMVDYPLRALLGGAQLVAGLGSRESQRAAQETLRRPSEDTLFDFGAWVQDIAAQNPATRPAAPALGTAAYTLPQFLSPF